MNEHDYERLIDMALRSNLHSTTKVIYIGVVLSMWNGKHCVSGGELCRLSRRSRNTVWKHLRNLERMGWIKNLGRSYTAAQILESVDNWDCQLSLVQPSDLKFLK